MLRLVFLCFLFCLPVPIFAGGWAFHMITAKKAISSLPPGELKDILSVYETPVLNGAKYPDIGFSVSETEVSYWLHTAEFMNYLLSSLEEGTCQNFDTQDCRKKLAFVFGCVAHEMGDVNFDKNFLQGVAKADFSGNLSQAQEYTDKRFDTVFIKSYQMHHWLPPFYQPIDLVLGAFQKADIPMQRKSLIAMHSMQALQYSVLIFYAQYAADRIAERSVWAKENHKTGPGGVEDTARAIADLWVRAWEVIESSNKKKLPRFRTWNHGWPNTFIDLVP